MKKDLPLPGLPTNCVVRRFLSGKYKSNSDIGVPSLRYFDEEVKKYCYMWREGGQFSTEKYTSDNIDAKSNLNI